MNVSASSIPCPVHNYQLSKRPAQSTNPQSDSEEGCTLSANPTRGIALYVRSATLERANTDKQISILFDYAAHQYGWIISTCFVDWGSGRRIGPGLRAMMNSMMSPDRGFDVILFTDFLRISRDKKITNDFQEMASSSSVALIPVLHIETQKRLTQEVN